MNERVFEKTFSGARVPSPASGHATVIAGEGTRAPRSFVTYAVEIEGDAPLYFSIEAVDE